MQELIQSNNAEIFELIQVLKMMPNLDQIKLGSIHLDSWSLVQLIKFANESLLNSLTSGNPMARSI